MKTTGEKISTVCAITGGLLFVSSFFVEDNKKAVKRRWLSLGLFAAGWGAEIVLKNTKILSK